MVWEGWHREVSPYPDQKRHGRGGQEVRLMLEQLFIAQAEARRLLSISRPIHVAEIEARRLRYLSERASGKNLSRATWNLVLNGRGADATEAKPGRKARRLTQRLRELHG